MEFHRVTRAAPTPADADETQHILTTHATSPTDDTPMQFISAAALAYHKRVEAAARALAAVLSKEAE